MTDILIPFLQIKNLVVRLWSIFEYKILQPQEMGVYKYKFW